MSYQNHQTDYLRNKTKFAKSLGVSKSLINDFKARVLLPLGTSETYTFKMEEGSNGEAPKWLQKLLTKTRMYQFFEVRLFVKQYLASQAQPGDDIARASYPWVNPNIFSDTDERNSLLKIFKGAHLAIKIGSKTILENFPISLSENEPIDTASTTNSSMGVRLEDKGFIPIDPNYSWKGDDEVQLILTLGPGSNTNIDGDPAAPTIKNLIGLDFKGFEHMGQAETVGNGCVVNDYAA